MADVIDLFSRNVPECDAELLEKITWQELDGCHGTLTVGIDEESGLEVLMFREDSTGITYLVAENLGDG